MANGTEGGERPLAKEQRRVASSEWRVASGKEESLLADSFYRQLRRLVYRFLFLVVSEDPGLISADALYRGH